jgi:hypothetical protein
VDVHRRGDKVAIEDDVAQDQRRQVLCPVASRGEVIKVSEHTLIVQFARWRANRPLHGGWRIAAGNAIHRQCRFRLRPDRRVIDPGPAPLVVFLGEHADGERFSTAGVEVDDVRLLRGGRCSR